MNKNNDAIDVKKSADALSGFPEEHRQEALPLEFSAANPRQNSTTTPTNVAPTAPESAPPPSVMETSAATAAKHRSLLHSERPDQSRNEPGRPAVRSAAYPQGYVRRENSPEIGVPVEEKQESNWRKNEIIERSEPERAAAAILEKKQLAANAEGNSANKNIDVHFGKMLIDARSRQNLSIAQVADITKIGSGYLEALEVEDFSRLPPPVFICAYVRKLCNLYKVNKECTESVVNELKKHMEVTLSEEIMNSIEIDRAKSPESEAKLRNLLWMGFAALVLFAGLISLALLILLAPKTSTGSVAAASSKPFDQARLDKLRPPVVVGMAEISAKR